MDRRAGSLFVPVYGVSLGQGRRSPAKRGLHISISEDQTFSSVFCCTSFVLVTQRFRYSTAGMFGDDAPARLSGRRFDPLVSAFVAALSLAFFVLLRCFRFSMMHHSQSMGLY